VGLAAAPQTRSAPEAEGKLFYSAEMLAQISVGGATWNIYRGSNGANAVFSFLRTSATNSGTVDVLAVLNWLRTQGWWGNVTIGDVQFGFELTGTAGQSNFVCNSFAINAS